MGERAIGGLAERLGAGDGARLDHIGIAVRSIADARAFYESLGIQITAEETVEHEQVRTAMLPLGETRLELLEATERDSTVAKFIAKRGEGMHHIAIAVGDMDAVFARLKDEGVQLASDCIRIGAGGHRYFFVHPESANGVLVEIVGAARTAVQASADGSASSGLHLEADARL